MIGKKGYTSLDRVKDSQKEDFDKKGFYIILTGKYNEGTKKYENIRLQYIGLAYDQSIKERVLQEHSAFSKIWDYIDANQDYTTLVKIGTIKDSSLEKTTKKFYEDIEACLINDNKPLCNTQSINNYNGRDIKVTNSDYYYPLNEESKVIKNDCSKLSKEKNYFNY